MKRSGILLIFIFILTGRSISQKVTFSEYGKKETRDIYFEILGRFDSNYLVYKNIGQKHQITRYDGQMKIVGNIPLDFVPDKTFNIDFITYRNYYFLIYQYQKNNIVYCKAMKMDVNGKLYKDPYQVDSTRLNVVADNKIYVTIFSEDKQKILVYKRQLKDGMLTLATKLFDADLQLLDSSRESTKFYDDKEVYSHLVLDNNGAFLFAKETKRTGKKDAGSDLEVILHKQGTNDLRNYKMSLGKKFIEEIVIKVDNLNNNYIINSFYFGQMHGSIEGLFTSFIDMNGEKPIRAAFTAFPDSFRYAINSTDKSRSAFDNLVIRNSYVRKNGGFIITAEDYYTESLYNNSWNRQYYNNSASNYNSYDSYLGNSYYNGYHPYGSGEGITNRYYYNDVIIMSIDSSLKMEWNRVIHKKQYDIDNDNFLSFTTLNAVGEVHFLFLDKDRQKQVISDQSISPNGTVKHYPTLKSNDMGHGFMLRHAKQTGARQLIVPFVYLNSIGFAKVDF